MSKKRSALRALLSLAGAALVSALIGLAALVAWLETSPVRAPEREVRDVTELVRIQTERVVVPETIAELQALLRAHRGPISLGGGRYSMGGQIGTDQALFVDLRALNRIVSFDPERRLITVEGGATWRDIIEHVDPHDLSVRIMQSYANFTVGGSLSVNAHGRYVGEGPLVHSVREIELMLHDGERVHASRSENADLFWAAVGGYGGIGVITTATLELTDNTRLTRAVERIDVGSFMTFFDETVRGDPDAVMFNADLYPPDYARAVAITFRSTQDEATVSERIQPEGGSTAVERFVYWYVSQGPLGKEARERVIDRLRLASDQVVWRNFEASYDVAGLDPGSRKKRTYILQEYFVPVEAFDDFVPRMRRVFRDHDVNVFNVSIRHASAEPDSLLTWAPRECFAFVVYHQMGTSEQDWGHAETWTRAMLDEVLAVEGTWYLPYQPHATKEQLRRGYPRFDEWAATKRRVDPDYTFRSRMLDLYLPPEPGFGLGRDPRADPAAVAARLAERPTWKRPEDQTFLTLPEWNIVYSADEVGAFLKEHRPSEFPWFTAIGQFWTTYRAVWGRTRDGYDFNTGYHLMIGVIGLSFTVEYGVKGLYEGSLGWLTEGSERVPEEDVYAEIIAEYGAFTHHTPWFAFPFAASRARIAEAGQGGLRGWERQLVHQVELTFKSFYGWLLGIGTDAAYGEEATTLEVWVRAQPQGLSDIPGVEVLEVLSDQDLLIAVPRYEPFTDVMVALAERRVEIVQISGASRIMLQIQAPEGWGGPHLWGDVLVRWPILSEPGRERIGLEIPVSRLDGALYALRRSPDVTLDRIYDY